MKSILYILGLGVFTIWIGFVDFTSVPKLTTTKQKEWHPTYEGLMELNSAKNICLKAKQEKEITYQRALEVQQQLKIIENDSLIRLSQNDLVE